MALSGTGSSRYSVRITGMDDLRRRLRNTEHGIEQLKSTNRRAAEVAGHTAMAMAPIRTGNLAATEREGATQRAGVVRFGGAAVPYACPIHWGWLTRPDPAKEWRGGKILPNAFASKAAQRTEPIWTQLYYALVMRNWNR